MRKLVATGLSIALAGTLLTGCMKMDGNIIVNTDGSCVLSTEINVEKDAMLSAYTKYLNEAGGGDGFTKEQVSAMLEQYGIKLVKIDNKEYYKISPDTAGQATGRIPGSTADNGINLVNNKFDNITNYYKSIAGKSYQTEDNVLSLSETSFVIKQPANSNVIDKLFSGSLEDSVASMLKGNAMRGDNAEDEFDEPDKVVPWEDDEYIDDEEDVVTNNGDINAVLKLFEDKEIMASLKTATMTYKVTFPSKIKERSANAVLSDNDKTVSVTIPLVSDRSFNEYAVCENDIAAEGAINGAFYKKAITVTIPENATAALNGNEISDKTVKCDKTGTYNFKLSDGRGTTETLCFMVDTSAPVVARQKEAGKAEFSDLYKGQEALLNRGYIAVYDIEGGVSEIVVDSTNVIKAATVNVNSNMDKDSLISQYYIYSLNLNDFDEGSHAISVSDMLGNKSEEEFIIDRTKPSVKGVKNGKTYKKAVTISFSDENGIQSASLNGKAFRNGSKASKKGTYTLKVTDNAGNVKTVKFKIKK
ncbi:MAG: hypothetical protein HFH68_03510 [Lachnospiraceae bacterium]|nr:hypothetical protein [Lachnospiraceae bacterium]